MKCPHCGQQHPDNAKFCMETGLKIEPQTCICTNPKCNYRSPLPLSAQFCPNCGWELCNMDTIEAKKNQLIIPVEKDEDLRLPVPLNGKWGYINILNEMIIPPIYDVACAFCDNVAKVKYNGKWGVLNRHGEYLLEPKWDSIEHSGNNMMLVRGTEGTGFFNLETHALINQFWNTSKIGFGPICIDNKWGYINTNGEMIIEPSFKDAYPFHENLAVVQIENKYGYIDDNGYLKIPTVFDYADGFNSGLAPVRVGDFYGYINKTGALNIPLNYQLAYIFEDGFAQIRRKGRAYLINNRGALLIEVIDSYIRVDKDIVALISNGKTRLINLNNLEEFMYFDNLNQIGKGSNGWIPYIRNNKIGIVGRYGQAPVYELYPTQNEHHYNLVLN